MSTKTIMLLVGVGLVALIGAVFAGIYLEKEFYKPATVVGSPDAGFIQLADGSKFQIPKGADVVIDTHQNGIREGDSEVTRRSIALQGGGMTTINPAIKDIKPATLGETNLETGAAGPVTGAGSNFYAAVQSGGSAWVFIIGGLMVAVGVALALWLAMPQGWILAAVGAGLVVLGFVAQAYAGVIAIIGMVIVVGSLMYYLWTHKGAFTKLVQGVENGLAKVDANAAAIIKTELSKAGDAATKALVVATKIDQNIPLNPPTPTPVVLIPPVTPPTA